MRLVVRVPPVGETKKLKGDERRKWSKLARSMVASREGRR